MPTPFLILISVQLLSLALILFSVIWLLPKRIENHKSQTKKLRTQVTQSEHSIQNLEKQLKMQESENESLRNRLSELKEQAKQSHSLYEKSNRIIEKQQAELVEKQRYLENCWNKIRELKAAGGIEKPQPTTGWMTTSFSACNACDKPIHFCTCSG